MPRGGGGGRGGGGRGSGGGNNGGLSAILDPMDQQMLDNYGMYKHTILSTWEHFAGNEGQMTIVQNHILPYSQEHVEQAREEWPYSGDADEYLDNVLNCFDSEVMLQAFSETIYSLYDFLVNLWMETDDIQREHDGVLGHSAVHSTNPPWTA